MTQGDGGKPQGGAPVGASPAGAGASAPTVHTARAVTRVVSAGTRDASAGPNPAQAQARQLAALQAANRLAEQLHALEARARAAASVNELAFSIANETYGLLGFRQALVLRGDLEGRLMAVSGLAKPAEDSPYLVWLRRLWPWLRAQWDAAGPASEPAASPAAHPPRGPGSHSPPVAGWFQPEGGLAGVPDALRDGWQEWWTHGVYVQPLLARDGKVLGWAVFLCNEAPAAWQTQALARLASTWGHAWEALGGPPRKGLWQRWRALGWPVKIVLLGVLAALLFLPVRQTALAPAEVVSQDARVVAAPIDGVIQTLHVRPNQAVKAGDPLFSLDDTTLRNRYEVARQSVAVADAELVAATQKAFHDPASQGELALLQGRSHERRAELAAVQAQLARVHVVAEHDGVAVYSDPDDWLGRPVSTGERIMLLADPARPGMLIHLPVADAIALEAGAPVKLFLTVRPLDPLAGDVTETSYQAVASPDGIASYRLRGAFDTEAAQRARIGLRGTAKLYGERVMLGYYLLRRPLASLREWTGW